MDYLDLNRFIEKVAQGELGPGLPIEVRNIGGDKIHRISFMDHCDELCRKHNTDRLRLLSVIQQKLNGDMIVRLSRAPVFKDKLTSVLNEWGETDIEPMDLFRCPENCYDTNNILEIMNQIRDYDNELNLLDSNVDEHGSSLFDAVEGLRNNYHSCGENLQRNLMEIEERKNEYEPVHRAILCDLSTRHKPFYLDNLMETGEQDKMVHHINKRVNRHIPDNIHTIFLNNVLIPNLIKKEMENKKSSCMKMKDDIDSKQEKLNEILQRIGPEEPFSVGLMKLISGLGDMFTIDTSSGEEQSDDEDNLERIMKEVVEKKEKGKKSKKDKSDEPDKSDESGEPNVIHNLQIIPKDEEEDEEEDDDQSGGDMSFF